MPVSISFTMDGMWAWLAENPGQVGKSRLITITKAAQKQAFTEWAKAGRGMPVGLDLRFSERGFNALNLTPRSPGYQGRQVKILGKKLPYTSPDNNSGTMRRLVLGGGYSITNERGGETVTTMLSVTGARGLNRLGSMGTQGGGKAHASPGTNGAVYRREFLAFDAGGKEDATWIRNRTNQLIFDALKKELESAQKRSEAHDGSSAGEFSGS